MTRQSFRGVEVLVVALLLGLLGDLVLRETPWGLNLLLCAVVFMGVTLLLFRRFQTEAGWEIQWLLRVTVLLAAVFVWRDAEGLQVILLLTMVLVLALAVWRARDGSLLRAAPIEYALGAITSAVYIGVGFPLLLFKDANWKAASGNPRMPVTTAVLRGLVVSVPLLIFFGLLLVEADPVFEKILSKVLFFDLGDVLLHIVLTLFWAWWTGGLLRSLLRPEEGSDSKNLTDNFPRTGVVEVGVVLGSLNFLFLSFVLVQFRYFFGGVETVLTTHGLTYASYARRGFYELLTVAAFILPLLLLADWLLRNEGAKARRVFNGLAGFQAVLLMIIIGSALAKLRIYISEYGLTGARIYPAAFLLWLAGVFMWFCFTVLRGRRGRFSFGGFVLALVCVFGLVAANPDVLSLRVNLDRAQEGKEFDAYYAGGLSADAIPLLLERLDELEQEQQLAVARRLLWDYRWSRLTDDGDWRSWNWSRQGARRVLNEKKAELAGSLLPDMAGDVPLILKHFDALPKEAQCRSAVVLLKKWPGPEDTKFYTWEKNRAIREVSAHRSKLEILACAQP